MTGPTGVFRATLRGLRGVNVSGRDTADRPE
jgi:hypothetical protein